MDKMEKAFIIEELRSFDCSSPSELDRKLLDEQSLLSAFSPESRALSDTAGEGFTSRASDLASLCLSDTVSPSPLHSSNIHEPDGSSLTVPVQGHFSTPQILLQKPRTGGGFDHSYSDLTALQVSWDVSLIRAEGCSPRSYTESSTQEQGCSPWLSPSIKVVVDGCRRKTSEAGFVPEGTTTEE